MSNSDDFKLTPHKNDHLLKLEGWRKNVGPLVALDLAAPSLEVNAAHDNSLVVLSWNVWIGHGRLLELVTRIRRGDFAEQGADADLPLVVLVQEAYRQNPGMAAGLKRHAGGLRRSRSGQTREDIVETANALGMNLRYAPSMRNSVTPSDRGNAILSTLPLQETEAVELPHLLQRRVAVMASVRVGGNRVSVVSGHLDPRGPLSHRVLGARGRGLQAQHLIEALVQDTVILGADLNIVAGRREASWRLLREAEFRMGVPEVLPRWRHTFHGLPHLLIDYVLVRDRIGVVARASVHRLDERPQDRGKYVFGSDHHPLLSRIDFAPTFVASSSSKDGTP
ncbi:MAG: endonuclease/exonuclease/phosphatase family protein [Gemmatimonas sp.]